MLKSRVHAMPTRLRIPEYRLDIVVYDISECQGVISGIHKRVTSHMKLSREKRQPKNTNNNNT